MTTPAAQSELNPSEALVSERVETYERQVTRGHFPDLRAFVQALDRNQKSLVLTELVKVDLERRWKEHRPRTLEEYFREYPELGDSSSPPLDLIQEEYRVRCRWGDAPSHASYHDRFQIETAQLDQALLQADRALQAETMPTTQLAEQQPAETPTLLPDASERTEPRDSQVGRQREKREIADADAPTTIGRYRVDQELGTGSFGSVYRCRDDELQRIVAIKLLHHEHAAAHEYANELIHEARTAARLRHATIVGVLDTLRCTDGRMAIVSEFVDGQTLRRHIRQRNFTRDEAIGWIADLADALAHAHKHQVVHRDVKPENILIDVERRPHLTDFGLAKLDDRFARDDKGKIVGTLAYMSPEQAAGQSHWASPQADVYSLGVLLYELLCGRLPFSAANQQELLEQIQHRPPPPLRAHDDTIAPELEAICLKAMAKDPAGRFTSAADLARALRGELRPRKNRWELIFGARSAGARFGVLVALGCLLVVFTMSRNWNTHSDTADPSAQPASPRDPNPSAAKMPQSRTAPRLEIDFQRAADKIGYRRLERADLPLLKGDKIQLHAVLPQAGYAYLYWYDGQGKPKRLLPADPAHVERTTEVWDPPKSDTKVQTWHVIGGAPATEMALLAVSDKPIPPAELARFEDTIWRSPPADAAHLNLLSAAYPEARDDDISRDVDGTAVTIKGPLQGEFEQTLQGRFQAYFALLVTHE